MGKSYCGGTTVREGRTEVSCLRGLALGQSCRISRGRGVNEANAFLVPEATMAQRIRLARQCIQA